MVFFRRKKKTTKQFGRELGQKIARIKKDKKVLRALEKEAAINKADETQRARIAQLKAQRPAKGFAKFVAGAKRTVVKGQKLLAEREKKLSRQTRRKGTVRRKAKIPRDDFVDFIKDF